MEITLEKLEEIIDKARLITTGENDEFTAEDITGILEISTYNWKFKYTNEDLIKLINNNESN